VPAEDRDQFVVLAHTIGWGFRPLQLLEHLAEVDDAVTRLLAYTTALLERRRLDPRDDLVSHLATTGDEAGYSIEECAAFLAGLVFAGNDTTRNQIGWMVAVLLDRPDLWDAIGTGDLGVEPAVEELMRYRSAAPAVSRRTTTQVEVGDAELPAGCPVLLSLWGADSDPAAYPAAAELDPVAKAGIPLVGCGHGPPHCLGAALARAELQESLRALCECLEPPTLRARSNGVRPSHQRPHLRAPARPASLTRPRPACRSHRCRVGGRVRAGCAGVTRSGVPQCRRPGRNRRATGTTPHPVRPPSSLRRR
jgi:hypothetical protein